MIWLVGSKGMLASEVARMFEARGIHFVGTDLEIDITDHVAVTEFCSSAPTWIVNCAAYTAVDRAEEEEDLANRINVLGPRNLARAAHTIGARLLHISTDYVFDGRATAPIGEEKPVNPLGAYGRTKAAGESAVRSECPDHVIIRTAWLYGRAGRNFVATMLRLMSERDEIAVVADQRGTPTFAGDLAAAIGLVVEAGEPRFGTFHFTNDGATTWHEFAVAIRDEAFARRIITKKPRVRAITTAEYPTRAVRPAYSVLDTRKIVTAYDVPVPHWRDGLVRYMDTIEEQ